MCFWLQSLGAAATVGGGGGQRLKGSINTTHIALKREGLQSFIQLLHFDISKVK